MKHSEQIIEVCQLGAGKATCKYLAMDGDGWRCLKVDSVFKPLIDERTNMTAQGDNCDGIKGVL